MTATSHDEMTEYEKEMLREYRNNVIEECARAVEQEAGDQSLIHVSFATQTIRALKENP